MSDNAIITIVLGGFGLVVLATAVRAVRRARAGKRRGIRSNGGRASSSGEGLGPAAGSWTQPHNGDDGGGSDGGGD